MLAGISNWNIATNEFILRENLIYSWMQLRQAVMVESKPCRPPFCNVPVSTSAILKYINWLVVATCIDYQRVCNQHIFIFYFTLVELFGHRCRVDRTSVLRQVDVFRHLDPHLLVIFWYIVFPAIVWPSPWSSSYWLDHECFTLGGAVDAILWTCYHHLILFWFACLLAA